jgi:hypothetical protein
LAVFVGKVLKNAIVGGVEAWRMLKRPGAKTREAAEAISSKAT